MSSKEKLPNSEDYFLLDVIICYSVYNPMFWVLSYSQTLQYFAPIIKQMIFQMLYKQVQMLMQGKSVAMTLHRIRDGTVNPYVS